MPLPPRRWFQFGLSTWFVLIAILAWAMIYWPWILESHGWHWRTATPQRPISLPVGVFTRSNRLTMNEVRLQSGAIVTSQPNSRVLLVVSGTHQVFAPTRRCNPALIYPSLALAAFVGCKSAWAIGRRVKARKVEQA